MEKISPRRTALGQKHTASRELVLRELELRGSASVAQLAARTELHENTVRGHLTALETDGHVRHDALESRGTRGRPTRLWSAVAPESQHPYTGLTIALATALSASHPDPVTAARAAGAAWGEKIAADRTPSGSPGSAPDLVTTVMREQGFAPLERNKHEKHAGHPREIILRRCPLLAAAAERSDIVCAVHEGMIAGLTNTQPPNTRVTLTPFAASGNCVLRMQDEAAP